MGEAWIDQECTWGQERGQERVETTGAGRVGVERRCEQQRLAGKERWQKGKVKARKERKKEMKKGKKE